MVREKIVHAQETRDVAGATSRRQLTLGGHGAADVR